MSSAIQIYKNNEKLGKLRVGTSLATPADGNLSVSGSVGVGVAPGAKLHVSSGTTNNIADDLSEVRFIGPDKPITGEQANLVIQTNDDVAINKGGSIGLGGRHSTSSTNGANFAQVSGRKENATSSNFAGYLSLSTSDSVSDIHERMRISSSGNVMIGSGTPNRLLELSNATNPALRLNNGNSVADIGVASSAGALLTGAADDDLVIARNGAYGISVGTNGTTRLSISSTGLATFYGGINLGHETITKYDEGAFTPLLNFGGAATGITYSSPQGGVYTRIGRLCYVQIAFVLTSKGSATGNATISGLPFNAGDLITNTSIENSLSFSLFTGLSDAVASVSGTSVTIRNLSGDSLNQNNFTDTTSIRLAGCYALTSS